MKPEEIKFGDWQRILFGEVPGEFFIEIIIRAAFIYLLLVVSMRLLGKRMAAQLGRNEMVALVTLAAAIGVPLQSPDRGLLPALIIAIVVVLIGRSVAALAFRSKKFEVISQDHVSALIEDSELQPECIKGTRLTPERIFAQLRSEGIYHLGQVKRLYLEANGSFTLVRDEHPQPGLSVLPSYDRDFINERHAINECVCQNCGHKQQEADKALDRCTKCEHNKWEHAVI
jgi:uncharacterized membrane protein YcaP (DUF421 family)